MDETPAGLLVGGHDALSAALGAALGAEWAIWRSPGLPARLAGGRFPAPLVYLAASRGRLGVPDPDDAEVVLTAAARAGAAPLVVVASTAVHEPSPHHPGLVEEERWRPRRRDNPLSAAWLALERVAAAAVPAERLLLLRAAPVPLPGGDDAWSRATFARLTATALGWDPLVQLLAVDDLAAALRAALARRLHGTFHLAPAPAPARRVVRAAGALRLALPAPLLAAARRLAGRPPGEVASLQHTATVSSASFVQATGVAPRWSTLQVPRRNRGESPAALADPDPLGFDPAYRRRLGRTLFRFLHDRYWRVDTQGVEHVPAQGRALLVGVHRGFQPWDGVMVQQTVEQATGRYARFLMHPALVKAPFLAPYMTRIGGVAACRENAARVLGEEGLLGVFPEGIRGAFSLYRDAYRLTPWFRDDFAELAIRHQAPIVPFVTIGTAETFPVLGRIDWQWFRRATLWPYLPVTTPLPLPAKWHTQILPPIAVDSYAPADADDPDAVAALATRVREQLSAALAALLARRRSRFFGGLAAPE
ncbi:MAG TPA: 1-acyl-sn-glycerol-3-phosphate acyltransferase [Thermoanaerobaculia bacterium]|nr:1-acyl-sn-glycerol-3-phosphate acyltransferase [Thermoanaerobaculia bacterium]